MSSAVSINIGKYKLGRKIGKGSFGEVYKCTDENGTAYAAKLEPRRINGRRRRGPSQLEYEFRVYSVLKGGDGIPNVLEFFVQDDYNVMIMRILGRSIQSVFERSRRNLSMDSVIAIGLRILSHLEFMHNRGMIHRDIKPQNILLGADSTDCQIYLIDFGLSKKYWTGGRHIPYRDGKRGLTGTPRYASINTHLGIEQSRRDDLESLGYVLIYLARGSLPWQGLKKDRRMRQNRHKNILEMKQRVTTAQLCDTLPRGIELYVSAVKKLKFEEKPPYDELYGFLSSAYDASRRSRR